MLPLFVELGLYVSLVNMELRVHSDRLQVSKHGKYNFYKTSYKINV